VPSIWAAQNRKRSLQLRGWCLEIHSARPWPSVQVSLPRCCNGRSNLPEFVTVGPVLSLLYNYRAPSFRLGFQRLWAPVTGARINKMQAAARKAMAIASAARARTQLPAQEKCIIASRCSNWGRLIRYKPRGSQPVHVFFHILGDVQNNESVQCCPRCESKSRSSSTMRFSSL